MKKNLLLYILLAFLIVMNGFFLFKHFGNSEDQQHQNRKPSNFIAKQLKFDETQTAQFEKLEATHRAKMETIITDIKRSKDALFASISDEAIVGANIESIANEIADKEVEKELEIFSFFKGIRSICNDDQKIRFESIIKDALHQNGGPIGNRPPPGRRDGGHRPPPPPGH